MMNMLKVAFTPSWDVMLKATFTPSWDIMIKAIFAPSWANMPKATVTPNWAIWSPTHWAISFCSRCSNCISLLRISISRRLSSSSLALLRSSVSCFSLWWKQTTQTLQIPHQKTKMCFHGFKIEYGNACQQVPSNQCFSFKTRKLKKDHLFHKRTNVGVLKTLKWPVIL